MSQDMANDQVAPMDWTVDEVMPPLRPQRGRQSKVAKAYEAAREQVRALLERLTAGEAYNRSLQADFDGAMSTVAFLQGELSRVRDRAHQERNDQQRDLNDLCKALLTLAQFVRLTGKEATKFRISRRIDYIPMKVTFEADDYSVTIVFNTSTAARLVLKSQRQQEMPFDLTDEGAIPTQAVLAILTLMGIQRDPKEAYAEQVYREIYGDPTSMLDKLFASKSPLGAIGLMGAMPDCGNPDCTVHGKTGLGGLFG